MAVYLGALVDMLPDPDNAEGYVARIKRAHVARQAERYRATRLRGVA